MSQTPVSLNFTRLDPSTGEISAASDKIAIFFHTTEQTISISYCGGDAAATAAGITLEFDTPISVIKNYVTSILLYHKMHHISVSTSPDYIDFLHYKFPSSKRKMYLYDEICRQTATILDTYIEHMKYIKYCVVGAHNVQYDTPRHTRATVLPQIASIAAADDDTI